ncbi:MAG: lipoprotein-releasing ABC transporter permease subunit [Pseudomonadota bacterium]
MSLEVFIGWRYFKSKRKQAFISVISLISLAGVALSVAALIVVLAVMTGFEEELKNKILGVNAHVMVLRYGMPLEDHQELEARIKSVKGVKSAEPFIYSQVLISSRGGVSGAVLRGVDPDLTAQAGHLAQTIKTGSLASLKARPESEGPSIILGVQLAQHLEVKVGDVVRVVSPVGRVTPLGGRAPVVRNFRVGAIFDTGMFEYDSSLAYISLAQAQSLLNLGQSVTGLEVRVRDVYRADQTRLAILEALGPTYWARDWMQMNRNLFAALKLQRLTLFIILSLTALVAAFNIISTLIMVVMEKTRDIAVLKSMGATRLNVVKIFVFQGLVIGGVGTLAGLGVGLFLCELLARYQFIKLPEEVYFLSTLPVKVESAYVAAISLSAVFISFLATIYPAWQASRLDPVEALRYE